MQHPKMATGTMLSNEISKSVHEYDRAGGCKRTTPSETGGQNARSCKKKRKEIERIRACKEGM